MKRVFSWIWPALFLVALFLMAPATAVAADGAKAFKTFHTIVDVAFMQEHATIPQRKDVMIVDSRPKARKYDKGHIPTAVSIPDRSFAKMTSLLPKDKGKMLVFYCGGFKCPLSHKSAFKAEAMGYTNVKVYAAGYPAWIKAGNLGAVSGDFVKKIADGKLQGLIIDARPKARKYDKGHIPTAISIPYREFDKHVAMLPTDKKALLVYYCGGMKCTLSPKSAMKAIGLGYTNVKIYPAGYPEWVKMFGPGPVASATMRSAPALDIRAGAEQGTISVQSFKEILASNLDSVLLVDVRDAPEFKAGTFKTAVNLPIDNLEAKVGTLPNGKPIIFFCNSGGLAGEAYDMAMLLRNDLTAYFLEAEVSHNADGSYEIKAMTN